MTAKPFYSVIVPVYNVGPYLQPCLDSLLAQRNAPPWEAVLVDDGSTDGSGAACDEYAGKYPNFRVLHIPNGGVSRARNLGMDAARGSYITFLDADDLLDPGALAALFPLLEKKPDMVLCRSQHFDETGKLEAVFPLVLPEEGETGDSYVRHSLSAGVFPSFSACLCTFSAAFLRRSGIRFPEAVSIGEDINFMMECYTQAKSLYGLGLVLYYYRQREGSATHAPSREKLFLMSRTLVKWFRRYPFNVFADQYAAKVLEISRMGGRTETRELVSFYRENRDILNHVNSKNMKIARAFFRVLGPYSGSAVLLWAIDLRHKIRRALGKEHEAA